MALQDFKSLNDGEPSLLREVELIVLDGHRRLYATRGKPWSEPVGYHWLRYEDPMPVDRLREGVKRLRRRGASFSVDAVDKACTEALKTGFLN